MPPKAPQPPPPGTTSATARYSLRRLARHRISSYYKRQSTNQPHVDSSHHHQASNNQHQLDEECDSLFSLPSTSTGGSIQEHVNWPIEKVFEEAESSLRLNFNERRLKEVPTCDAKKFDLSDLVFIELADLSGNYLTQLPKFITELEHLETLVVQRNRLRTLDGFSFRRLDSLTYLDLSWNQLTALPDSFFDCLRPSVLLLRGNALEELNAKIEQFATCLQELDVSANRLKRVCDEVGTLHALRVLNLSENLIVVLPSALSVLTLQIFDISRNRLTKLPCALHSTISGRWFSGVRFSAADNPLTSPPIEIVNKGRMHVAKWLENLAMDESNNNELGVYHQCVNNGGWTRSKLAYDINTLPSSRKVLRSYQSLKRSVAKSNGEESESIDRQNPVYNYQSNHLLNNNGVTTNESNGTEKTFGKSSEALKRTITNGVNMEQQQQRSRFMKNTVTTLKEKKLAAITNAADNKRMVRANSVAVTEDLLSNVKSSNETDSQIGERIVIVGDLAREVMLAYDAEQRKLNAVNGTVNGSLGEFIHQSMKTTSDQNEIDVGKINGLSLNDFDANNNNKSANNFNGNLLNATLKDSVNGMHSTEMEDIHNNNISIFKAGKADKILHPVAPIAPSETDESSQSSPTASSLVSPTSFEMTAQLKEVVEQTINNINKCRPPNGALNKMVNGGGSVISARKHPTTMIAPTSIRPAERNKLSGGRMTGSTIALEAEINKIKTSHASSTTAKDNLRPLQTGIRSADSNNRLGSSATLPRKAPAGSKTKTLATAQRNTETQALKRASPAATLANNRSTSISTRTPATSQISAPSVWTNSCSSLAKATVNGKTTAPPSTNRQISGTSVVRTSTTTTTATIAVKSKVPLKSNGTMSKSVLASSAINGTTARTFKENSTGRSTASPNAHHRRIPNGAAVKKPSADENRVTVRKPAPVGKK